MKNDNMDNESRGLWERAKDIYLNTLSSDKEKNQAERHFGMINGVEKNGNVLIFYTVNEFARDIIIKDYATKLQASFMLAGETNLLKIEVRCSENPTNNLVIPKVEKINRDCDQPFKPTSTFVSTIPLNEEYTFSSFVRGPSNSFALSAAEGVVKNPGRMGYNPLFIHGGTGLGKTHLMQAIGNDLKNRYPNMAICYLTAETFLNEYISSLQNQQIENFRQRYRSLDLLLLDDVQFLQKGKNVQEEFFNTFNALKDKHRQIVMTSDVAPKNLPSIEDRLISRFEGGMVQEVESPSYETRYAILKKKAEGCEVKVPENVLEFIADNIKSHVRAMEGALAKACIFINSRPGEILTNDVLGNLLKDFIEKEQNLRKLNIEEIQQACAKKFNVQMSDILSHERSQTFVTPRQLAMYICRKYTTKSLQEIGDAFGKKHATILNGVKTITERLVNEKDLKIDLEEILSSFGYKLSDLME